MTSFDINYFLTPSTVLMEWILEGHRSVYHAATMEVAVLCWMVRINSPDIWSESQRSEGRNLLDSWRTLSRPIKEPSAQNKNVEGAGVSLRNSSRTCGCRAHESMRERKGLDSRETQGLEQIVHHFVAHCNTPSGGVTWSDLSFRRIPVVVMVCELFSSFL